MQIRPEIEIEKLLKALLPMSPWDSKVFAVGGMVRDEILGIKNTDLDILVSELHGAQDFSFYLKSQLGSAITTPHQRGASYPIWHISFKDHTVWKGTTYYTRGGEVDLTETQDLAQDTARRDFTVNMLFKDLTSGEILDLSGKGLEDLKDKRLQHHPEVRPAQMFEDDPLRLLRAIRFHVCRGFELSAELLESIPKSAPLLTTVSGERLREELLKILDVGALGKAIKLMDTLELLPHFLPEVSDMKGVEQDVYHHSEGDVFVHTLMLLEKAQPTAVAQLSALLHDVGKPCTQTIHPLLDAPPRIKFLGHDQTSHDIAGAILRRLKFETVFIEKVQKIVLFHLRPHTADKWSPKALRKFIRDCGQEIEDILHLAEIDNFSSFGPEGVPKENGIPDLRKRIAQSILVPVQKRSLLSGKRAMDYLQLKEGREVGNALALALEIEDEMAIQGITLTEDELLVMLKERLGTTAS